MKKHSTLNSIFLMAILLCTISSCHKTTNTTNCRITKIQNTLSDTSLISYDAQNNIAVYGYPGYLFTFTYSGLTASANIQTTDTAYHYTNAISLDSKGRMTYMSKSVNAPGYTYFYTYNFTYDADGHIVLCDQTMQQLGVGGTTYYRDSLVYTNGNLVDKYTVTKSSPTGNYFPYQHIQMAYSTDLNKIGNFINNGYEDPISVTSDNTAYYPLFGTPSKNLPSTLKFYDNTGALFIQVGFSFLLDANGYPTEENMVRSINYPGVKNRKFEYTCN